MPVFQLRHGTARTIRVQVLAEWLGAVRDHVVARCYGAMPKSGYQVPYSYGGNEKAPLKLRESANTNFLLARDNRMERHWVHPRNYPRVSVVPRTHRTQETTVIGGSDIEPCY